MIVEKLANKPGLSYAEIANTAYKVGQPKLATRVGVYLLYVSSLFIYFLVLVTSYFYLQLLDYEPRAADQVPLLMSMQEDELALIKAIESGDTDLGNFVY